jgi:hypothetical protein
MNGNITKEGITADLEAMAEFGIGGAQIFNVGDKASCNIPVGGVGYMSDEWLDAVEHAVKEAKRLGIEICMHNCAGWSSSGGPWITPEYAMKIVSYSEKAVSGGKVSVALEKPRANRGFYRDIAVIAFPTPADNAYRLPDAGVKADFGYRYGIDLSANLAPEDAVIPSEMVLDISDKMDASGKLLWNCPEGSWTVLRLGYTITGKNNHPAPDSGLGLECDKLSRAALDLHWEKGIVPILEKLGDLAGPVMNNLLIDSYEVGTNNWTQGFENEFESLRGYDMTKYLPAITGRVVDGTGASERFLWDYRRTISDLFTANYYGYFADKCHEVGLLCSAEPYEGPFECLSIDSKADILMGEFWIGGGMNSSMRIASSVAHVYGRKIVGAESFTSGPDQGRWQNHPRTLKTTGDMAWSNGINRYIFHRYALQPWLDQWPGMTMGQWGTHFERTNTWWKDGAEWAKYIQRGQALLQAGRFYADVLYFGGEFVPQGAIYHPELKDAGYDYDAIGTDLILALSVEDGKICLPSGMKYSVLVMPESETMSVAVARKIQELLEAGATVVAPKPERCPSLAGYPESEKELAAIADSLWGKGLASSYKKVGRGILLSGLSAEQALEKVGIEPDFKALDSGSSLLYIHRVIEGADVYFVSNQQDVAGEFNCRFRVTGKAPVLWDPQDGSIKPAMIYSSADKATDVTLSLPAAGSVFVVFEPKSNKTPRAYVSLERQGGPVKTLGVPRAKLEIVKATYGRKSLTGGGIVDVTSQLSALVKNNRLSVMAGNDLAGDPIFGEKKTLLVEYTYDGRKGSVKINEGNRLNLPEAGAPAGKKLTIDKAVYGDLPDALAKLPEMAETDLTDKVRAQLKNNVLNLHVNNQFAGGDPVPNLPKQLTLIYLLDGVEKTAVANEYDTIHVPSDVWSPSPWPAELLRSDDADKLLVWDEGTYRIKRAAGSEAVVKVPQTKEPILLKGPWDVKFESKAKAPAPRRLASLCSLSDMTDEDVRHFSGTAIYSKRLRLAPEAFSGDPVVMLDLGRVEVMARVVVNGKDLGVLWKYPYRIDLTDALRDGDNLFEIHVTNLWVNRLIGDAAYPQDFEWTGKSLVRWPEWFVNGTPRPSSQRTTFTTWRHWYAGDDLQPSGLIGPVYVRIGEVVELD